MIYKKGVSTIVAALILIVLVLVAVGIVWAVVSNLIGTGSETVEISGKCVTISVKATAVDCSVPSACLVTLERSGTGTDDIGGVKLVFKNATVGASSSVMDEEGDIEQLIPNPVTIDLTNEISNPNSVETTIYLIDGSGEKRLCAQTTTFDF